MDKTSYITANYYDYRGVRKGAGNGSYQVPERTRQKVNRMTTAALEAAGDLQPHLHARPERTGICMANCLGGWDFGEPEMMGLHQLRIARWVNVYLGTASFPHSALGEVSIAHGYMGHSKTFMGGGEAYYQAIFYAHFLLQLGIVDQVLVGAVESVTSPWLLAQLETSPLEPAACFLLLAREPEPACRLRVTTEIGTAATSDNARPAATDMYPVDAAARLINEIEGALSHAPCVIRRRLPGESRQLVFHIG